MTAPVGPVAPVAPVAPVGPVAMPFGVSLPEPPLNTRGSIRCFFCSELATLKVAGAPVLTVRTLNVRRRTRGSNARMMPAPGESEMSSSASPATNTLTVSAAIGAVTARTTA